MRRYLWGAARVLSAVMCILTVTLWVRGYWASDVLGYSHPSGWETIDSRRGQLSFNVTRATYAAEELKAHPEEAGLHHFGGEAGYPGVIDRVFAGYEGIHHHWHGFGFRWFVADKTVPQEPGRPGYRLRIWDLGVPHWLVALAFAVPPTRWALRHVRRRRITRRVERGLCAGCGYDLRASSKRCPECGRRIEVAAAARSTTS